MRIVYVLLSPTAGMHQYTGDLAAQMLTVGHEVLVVTTTEALALRDRYPADVALYTPLHHHSTGFACEGLDAFGLWRVYECIVALKPNVVHFGGVHLWNPLLVVALRRQGLVVVHTLHDLDPHPDVAYGSLIRLWNRSIISCVDGLLVHGECYRARLLANGRPADTVLATPLLHTFLSVQDQTRLMAHVPAVTYEPWALFFGRLERYKGLEVLLRAQSLLVQQGHQTNIVVAGGGNLAAIWPHALPQGVTMLNRFIQSKEGSDLFSRCGVVVLPYTGATQSSLPATAYAFGKPVIVTSSGALAEVIEPGITGWVTPPGNIEALAECLATVLRDPAHLAIVGAAGRRRYDNGRGEQALALQRFYTQLLDARN